MKNKLQYTHSPDFPQDVHFQHEWKIDHPYLDDIATLREMVAWCFQNWNDDPNYDHEWHYTVIAETRYFYCARDSSWNTWESPNCFYFGTNDDQWAVTFKLAWSDSIG